MNHQGTTSTKQCFEVRELLGDLGGLVVGF
jgi:hypothetical protein